MTYTRFTHTRCVIALTFVVGTALIASAEYDGSSAVSQPAASTRRAANIRVEVAPSTTILSREVTGSYAQHPAMLAELRRYVTSTNTQAIGPVMGIYPMDPDVVPENELVWQVAVPVAASPQVASPYVMSVLPRTETVALTSTVGQLEDDANFLKKWLIDNGFVQIGATRMLFHDPDNRDPRAVKTTIVYPVKRRASPSE